MLALRISMKNNKVQSAIVVVGGIFSGLAVFTLQEHIPTPWYLSSGALLAVCFAVAIQGVLSFVGVLNLWGGKKLPIKKTHDLT